MNRHTKVLCCIVTLMIFSIDAITLPDVPAFRSFGWGKREEVLRAERCNIFFKRVWEEYVKMEHSAYIFQQEGFRDSHKYAWAYLGKKVFEGLNNNNCLYYYQNALFSTYGKKVDLHERDVTVDYGAGCKMKESVWAIGGALPVVGSANRENIVKRLTEQRLNREKVIMDKIITLLTIYRDRESISE